MPSFVEIDPMVLWKEISEFLSNMYFCYFAIISPWIKVWPFIPSPKLFQAKFDQIWPSGSGEDDENVKFTDRWMNNKQQATRKAHYK